MFERVFSFKKNFSKGVKGAVIAAVGSVPLLLSSPAGNHVSVSENPLADSLAVAMSEGDWHRARYFAIAAVIGFAYGVVTNFVKNYSRG